MFRSLFSWFARRPQETVSEIPDEALFLNDKGRTGTSPHLPSISRDYQNVMKACDIAECQRPSAFDVITLQHLKTDVPFTHRNREAEKKKKRDIRDDFLETQSPLLPTYQFYALCDRHYESFVRGKASNGQSTKLVIGPQVRYNVDEEGDKTYKSPSKYL